MTFVRSDDLLRKKKSGQKGKIYIMLASMEQEYRKKVHTVDLSNQPDSQVPEYGNVCPPSVETSKRMKPVSYSNGEMQWAFPFLST